MTLLEQYKKDYFELRPASLNQPHIFMQSREDKQDRLIIGPLDQKAKHHEIRLRSLLKGVQCVIYNYIETLESKEGAYIFIEDPTCEYNLLIRVTANRYSLKINEFQDLVSLCNSNSSWFKPIFNIKLLQLLQLLLYLYIYNVNLKAENIFVDVKRNKYYIFDIFHIRNTENKQSEYFFFNESPKCDLFKYLGAFYTTAIDRLNKLPVDYKYKRNHNRAIQYLDEAYKLWVKIFATTISEDSMYIAKQINDSITYSGIDFLIALQLLEYFILRNEEQYALKLGAELYLFKKDKKHFELLLETLKLVALKSLSNNFNLALSLSNILEKSSYEVIFSVIVELCQTAKNRYLVYLWHHSKTMHIRSKENFEWDTKDINLKTSIVMSQEIQEFIQVINEHSDGSFIEPELLYMLSRFLTIFKQEPNTGLNNYVILSNYFDPSDRYNYYAYHELDKEYITNSIDAIFWMFIEANLHSLSNLTREQVNELILPLRRSYYKSGHPDRDFYLVSALYHIMQRKAFDPHHFKLRIFIPLQEYLLIRWNMEDKSIANLLQQGVTTAIMEDKLIPQAAEPRDVRDYKKKYVSNI